MIVLGGPLATAIAWIIAAILMLPLAFVLVELSAMFPLAGGPYIYKYVAFKRLFNQSGALPAFMSGWLFWLFLVIGFAISALGMSNLLTSTFWGAATKAPVWFPPAFVLSLFLVMTALNLLRVHIASKFNNFLTLIKFGVLLSFAFLALTTPGASFTNLLNPANLSGRTNLWTNVMAVLPIAVAGMCGMEMAGCVGSETVNAQKNIPWAILMTLLTNVIFWLGCGLAVGVISPYVLSADKTTALIAGTQAQATAPSLATFCQGPVIGALVTAGVLLAGVNYVFSGLLATSRIGFSMAKTGLFPKSLAVLNEKTKVPENSLWFQLAAICVVGIAAQILAASGFVVDAYAYLTKWAALFMPLLPCSTVCRF